MAVNCMITTIHISIRGNAIKYKNHNTHCQYGKYNDTIGIIIYRLHNISPRESQYGPGHSTTGTRKVQKQFSWTDNKCRPNYYVKNQPCNSNKGNQYGRNIKATVRLTEQTIIWHNSSRV